MDDELARLRSGRRGAGRELDAEAAHGQLQEHLPGDAQVLDPPADSSSSSARPGGERGGPGAPGVAQQDARCATPCGAPRAGTASSPPG